MKVCEECGWYALLGHEQSCWPEAGAACDALITRVARRDASIRATKLGYGSHRVTFKVVDDLTFILSPSCDGKTFSIDDVYAHGRYSEQEIASLLVAVSGAIRRILFDRLPVCAKCNGSGEIQNGPTSVVVQDDNPPETCSACRGQGRVAS